MAPEVSVIIVVWNARELIDRCLEAVLGAGGAGVELEVIVVDNASSDDTVERVRSHWCARDARVRLIETGTNGGMAAGNNVGMRAASGDSLLLLNSDAFLEPGALQAMVDRLHAVSDATLAAVAPQLRNTDGTLQRSLRGFPTTWRYATELLYLRRMAPRSQICNAFYGGGLDTSRAQRVDWVTGACLLVPRAAIEAVGLMDESFFMYGEEVDWLRRMHRVGRSVWYEPAAQVVHVGGGSARREWGRMYQLQLANHVRYMSYNEGPSAARRVHRLLRASLVLRAAAYRTLATLWPRARRARRARAAAFAQGARQLRSSSVPSTEDRSIPPLH